VNGQPHSNEPDNLHCVTVAFYGVFNFLAKNKICNEARDKHRASTKEPRFGSQEIKPGRRGFIRAVKIPVVNAGLPCDIDKNDHSGHAERGKQQ
jgi:hypothetical protein